jgi:hypothetical protein
MDVMREYHCSSTMLTIGIDQDPRAPRPYLFSDGQNMYNEVVLVYAVNVYKPASLGRRPILKYQVLQFPTKLYSLHLQSED